MQVSIKSKNDAIGVGEVRRYAWVGERFGAEEARRIGLLHDAAPASDLEDAGAQKPKDLRA
jgi:methylglutaconyl-CoA hydratase